MNKIQGTGIAVDVRFFRKPEPKMHFVNDLKLRDSHHPLDSFEGKFIIDEEVKFKVLNKEEVTLMRMRDDYISS